MDVPERLKIQGDKKNIVCKLNKSLYGLKQDPHCWNVKFDNFLKAFKFKESQADKCIYRGLVMNKIVYLALFVDDGLIVSELKPAMQYLTDKLRNMFKITVTEVNTFIGMQ